MTDFLALHVGNRNRTCCGYGTKGGIDCRKGFVLVFGQGGEGRAVLCSLHPDLVVGLRGEIPVLQIAGADHHQRGCLYPSERKDSLPDGDGECLRGVQADFPIGDGTGFGGTVEVVVAAAGFEILQPFPDGTVGQRGNPQADKGLAAIEVVVNIAEDSFAFTTCISRHDDPVRLGENFPDHL